jgi:type 1 glutamine amidotransferase
MSRWFASALAAAIAATATVAQPAVPTVAEQPKRLLLVTHSGGFMHDSIGVAEQVLTENGRKYGFTVTCYRFTGDPDATVVVETKDPTTGAQTKTKTTAYQEYAERLRKTTGLVLDREHCGRVNKETLRKFDAVLFFTTGDPLTKDELADLTTWVRDGGAFAGTHCATDTLYPRRDAAQNAAYGELVGAYFAGHPWTQKVRLKVEDPNHPAARGFKTGDEIKDEIYVFRDSPYSREKLHVILSLDNASVDVSKGNRGDRDYAVSWCRQYGKGRSFYTSLGHFKEVWTDQRFQQHLFGGLRWAVGLDPGDATPSGKK